MRRILVVVCLAIWWMAASEVRVGAQQPVQPPPAAAAESAGRFDAKAATDAYLATVPPAEKARSDAYFEGGYWLVLWTFLYDAAVALMLLRGRFSAGMRDRAARLTRRRPLQTALYWVQFTVVTTVASFPLTWYQGFYREHQYGLATQDFAGWLSDLAKALGVSLVLGGVFLMILYGVLRRAPRTWPVWGAIVSIVFLVFTALIAPVYIAPIFNTYTKVQNPAVRDPILRLARANGIRAGDVYEVDASRQSTRISANVSGLLGTERITLNDNLLKRCSLPEIEAVMGHEMGHYVLNQVYELILFFTLVIIAGFLFVRRGMDRALARWGAAWVVREVSDPASFPLLMLLLSTYFLLLTPLLNTFVRANEYEADVFGLNAARQPDGFAQVSLKLGEYRKLEPSPFEEWFFFDHPSGHTRIMTAMRWKAENLGATVPGQTAVEAAAPRNTVRALYAEATAEQTLSAPVILKTRLKAN